MFGFSCLSFALCLAPLTLRLSPASLHPPSRLSTYTRHYVLAVPGSDVLVLRTLYLSTLYSTLYPAPLTLPLCPTSLRPPSLSSTDT